MGLVVARPPEILRADAFFPSFIAGLETVLSERGNALLLQVAERDDAAAYRRLAREGRVDGVFVTDLQIDDQRPSLLEELGLPAVIVGPDVGPGLGARQSVLGVDDAPGVRAAVRHLLELGHTRIAHVSGPPSMVHGRSRRRAWSGALLEAGLPDDLCVEADFSAESGAAATRRLLDLADPPTAIVFANDLMAMAGLSLAVARGIRVPDELSVTGYDDMEISGPPPAVADHRGHRRGGLGPRGRRPAARADRPGAPDPRPPARRPPGGARLHGPRPPLTPAPLRTLHPDEPC